MQVCDLQVLLFLKCYDAMIRLVHMFSIVVKECCLTPLFSVHKLHFTVELVSKSKVKCFILAYLFALLTIRIIWWLGLHT